MRSIRPKVERVLELYPQARNDDKYLQLKVWEHYNFFLSHSQTTKFMELPSSESIRRTRQKLQAEGKYRADKEVREIRRKLARETRTEMVADKLLDKQVVDKLENKKGWFDAWHK